MRRLALACVLLLAACAPTIDPTFQDGSPNGGSDLTITGTGFATVTAVTLSGVPVTSFTIVSPTQIDAVAAPGPVGFGDIVVTSPDGSATCVGCWVYEPDVPEP